MKAAPKGMDQCTTTLCGSSANGKLTLISLYVNRELNIRKRIQTRIHGLQTARKRFLRPDIIRNGFIHAKPVSR
jgi:hypothetical protein